PCKSGCAEQERAAGARRERAMRSRQLQTVLTDYVEAAAGHLRAEVQAGAEVPFEVGSRVGRAGTRGTPLYCYRALTGEFIDEREAALKRLPCHAEAAKLLGLRRPRALPRQRGRRCRARHTPGAGARGYETAAGGRVPGADR